MSDGNRCIAGQTFKFGFMAEASGSSSPQLSPTLAAADFRISINGGSLTALTNTPTNTPSGSAWIEVILAAAETTSAAAGGLIRFQAIDAAGAEWKYWGCLIPVFADEAASTTNVTAGTITTVTNLTNAPTAGDFTVTMKSSITTAANLATPTVTVGTNNDKTGYALSSAGILAIWAALTSTLTTAGSIGKLIVDYLDAAISSRMATFTYTMPPTAAQIRTEIDANSTQLAKIGTPSTSLAADIAVLSTYVDTEVAAIKAKTDNLPASPAATGDIPSASTVASAVWTNGTRTLTSSGSGGATAQEVWEYGTRTLSTNPPTAGAIADAVWDEATTGHTTAGTFGEQAKTDIDAIKAKTDNLPASPAAVGDIPSATANATAVWANSTRTLSSFGTLVSSIWSNSTRTLTSGGGSGGATPQEIWEYILDGPFTAQHMLNIMFAVLSGKSIGGGTATPAFRDAQDTKNRASYTLDSNGNRTPVTRDGS